MNPVLVWESATGNASRSPVPTSAANCGQSRNSPVDHPLTSNLGIGDATAEPCVPRRSGPHSETLSEADRCRWSRILILASAGSQALTSHRKPPGAIKAKFPAPFQGACAYLKKDVWRIHGIMYLVTCTSSNYAPTAEAP